MYFFHFCAVCILRLLAGQMGRRSHDFRGARSLMPGYCIASRPVFATARLLLLALLLSASSPSLLSASVLLPTWSVSQVGRGVAAPRLPFQLRGGSDEAAATVDAVSFIDAGAGAVPYEGFLARSSVENVLSLGKAAVGKTVAVCGWARTIRVQGSGTFAFLELNDGSSFHNIQVVVDKGIDGWDDVEANAHTHTSWRAEGVLVDSPGKGQDTELKATAIRLLGSSPPEMYPLAKGRLPLEFLRGHPHLRARTNTHGAVARVRSALAFAVHRFFDRHSFHYVHAPIITTSDCEGAGELFAVTTLLNDLRHFPKLIAAPESEPAGTSGASEGGAGIADARASTSTGDENEGGERWKLAKVSSTNSTIENGHRGDF